MKSLITEINPQFHDCDPMNVVWHGNYVKYLEVARCELLESLNYNYDEMLKQGHAWPVVDIRIKYSRPIHFKQRILIEAKIIEWEYRLKISYEIRDAATGERLCKATTTQMVVELATQTTCFEVPEVFRQRLGVE